MVGAHTYAPGDLGKEPEGSFPCTHLASSRIFSILVLCWDTFLTPVLATLMPRDATAMTAMMMTTAFMISSLEKTSKADLPKGQDLPKRVD